MEETEIGQSYSFVSILPSFLSLKERKRNIDLLFHLFMHSLVDSGMCPDQGLNSQPWCIGMML